MRSRVWIVGAVYGLLLLAHHGVRWSGGDLPAIPDDVQGVEVAGTDSSALDLVRLAAREAGPEGAPTVVLLHGVPGSSAEFRPLLEGWDVPARRLAFDLPGFGASGVGGGGRSSAAAATYVLAALDSLGVERAHLVGVGQGGSVAIEMLRRDVDRARSLVLVSATGVEEFELLGNVDINRPLYGAQLAVLWFLDHFVPHFGFLERLPLNLPYARYFYESDARPARAVLEELSLPMLVVHGQRDFLVPPEVAREHARIVPQAELEIVRGGGHDLLDSHPGLVRARLRDWVERVEQGTAITRANATEHRRDQASVPIDEIRDFRAHGITLWLLLVLIVFATFVSEDATSIGVGLLIAQGRVGWLEGFGAVFVGIYFGDLILYGVGHWLGMKVVHRAPFRWFLSERDLRRGSEWFGRRGLIAIFLTRFVPGSRLPTYLAVGVVRAGFWRFAGFFFVAVMAWTPVLVGFAAVVGHEALERFEDMRRDSLIVFLVVVGAILLFVRVVFPLTSRRGRRLAVGRWTRWRRWEFWPSWIVYLPIVLRAFVWGWRHGGLTVPTATNWGMSGAGGMIGESKAQILAALDDGLHVARTLFLPVEQMDDRQEVVDAFIVREGLDLPVVLKPDVGQRGEGVHVVRSRDRLRQLLAEQEVDLVLQAYVGGEEYGVSYEREPGAERGHVTSIAQKQSLVVEGDGESSLEHLILEHPRAVALAERHLRRHADRLDWVPDEGQRVVLAEIGTHSRGSVFVDANDLWTRELDEAIDRLSQRFEGFHLGRYDLRVPSADDLRAGRAFVVLELNGLTAEPAHIYDPAATLGDARRELARQWEAAYRFGAMERARGRRVWPLRAILREWWSHRRRQRHHAADRAHGARESFMLPRTLNDPSSGSE
ncbi:MAG TPA: alpha/beta fold hydrolase [Candidatus Krumholzibacteria bacterium]|nr:alpha/beta fold hydrolase [Candidatus Krumholzibacteria bacterium]